MRIIVFDTETTGLDPKKGDRVVELACVEIVDRSIVGTAFHSYFTPEGKQVAKEALEVHGLSDDFLQSQPKFSEKADEIIKLMQGAHIIAHNASFDIGFLNNEFKLVNKNFEGLDKITNKITDTLALSRQKLSLPKHRLDDLCDYFKIDRSKREKHEALLDTELLAEVYLGLTAGQTAISLAGKKVAIDKIDFAKLVLEKPLSKVNISESEIKAHNEYY